MAAADRILLATGLKEVLPNVPYISRYYGISLFSCPYCDGYELINQPLAIISEGRNAIALVTTVSQWSSKLHLFTNGKFNLTVVASHQYLKNLNGLVEAVNFLDEYEKNQ